MGYLYFFINETWKIGLLDQPNMTIEQLFPSGSPPPAMRHSVAVYDSTGNRMVMFSGQDDGGGLHNEVWELRLTPGSEQWNTLAVGGTPPPAMFLSAVVLDQPNRRMIVFGGNTGGGQINDVYALGGLWLGVNSPNPPSIPVETRILSIRPNPSRGEFTFDYHLGKPSTVLLRIFDVTGRLVRNVGEEVVSAGLHQLFLGRNDGGKTILPERCVFV